MSGTDWRLKKGRTESMEENDKPGGKATRVGEAPKANGSSGSSGAGGNGNHDEIVALQKLGLNLAQRQRQLEASTYDFALVPQTSAVAAAGLAEGKQYNKKVQELGKGHGLGSPHTHVIIEMLEKAVEQYSEGCELPVLAGFVQLMNHEGQDEVAEAIPHCKVQETNNPIFQR